MKSRRFMPTSKGQESSIVSIPMNILEVLTDVRYGSWLCENALAEGPTTCDFGKVAVFGHLAVF
jgi:hypothetical protein